MLNNSLTTEFLFPLIIRLGEVFHLWRTHLIPDNFLDNHTTGNKHLCAPQDIITTAMRPSTNCARSQFWPVKLTVSVCYMNQRMVQDIL